MGPNGGRLPMARVTGPTGSDMTELPCRHESERTLDEMLKGFGAFILRGNVIDLAVGVAIGAAFTAVVTSFTENLLTPLLAIPGDAAKFSDLDFTISDTTFRYGAVI